MKWSRGLVVLAAAALVAPVVPAAHAQEPGEQKFRMPKVVGMVLQDAQDLLQDKGSYVMDQKDAKGWGRWQLLDSGWKVCRQRPRAGTVVPVSTVVTLWSVKLSERCPS